LLLEGAGEPYQRSLSQLETIDVVVIAMRLRHRFSRYFWLNVSDPLMNLAGIVEHTNLSPRPDLGGDGILYLPHYLPDGHPLHGQSDEELFDLACRTLTAINPAFEPAWVRGYWVHRDKYAQPICDVGFSSRTPSIQTPVDALFLTDSCQLHPYDRSVSGSIGLGKTAAQLMLARA
jgi:protoporphyrinogen oxidase